MAEEDNETAKLVIDLSADTAGISRALKKVRRAIDAATAVLDGPEEDVTPDCADGDK